MKIKVLYILTFLLIYISAHNSQLIASDKKEPDFTQLIQALTTQLRDLQKEIKKEDAVVKLRECTIEIKWVWKYEGGARVKAFLVEGGGKYGKDEINSFRSVWEPIGDIYASNENSEGLNDKLTKLEDKLELRDNDISDLKKVLYKTLTASKLYYEDLETPQYTGRESPQSRHTQYLLNIMSLPIFNDIKSKKSDIKSEMLRERYEWWGFDDEPSFQKYLKDKKDQLEKKKEPEEEEHGD